MNRMACDRDAGLRLIELGIAADRIGKLVLSFLVRLHRGPSVFLAITTITLGGGFLSGCSGPLSTMDPAGPSAEAINSIWWAMLAGAAAIFLLVGGLLAWAFVRRGDGTVSARTWIVGGGLIFPTVVLLMLLAYGLVIGERLLPRSGPDVVEVEARSSRWQWTFHHRRADGSVLSTPGVLHIPAGRPVDVVLTTQDVIHAFWVPRLAGKMDAIPGHRNVLRIEAGAPGTHPGICAEYCGIGHARHSFRVVVHDEAGWARFLAGEGA
ncbi:cytochrome c oxidase subunit II [Novosphingobium sp. M1R2S20]|uniref:Cytochrome c oxidase subunit II n=1 Tax=Novosphingobium rhizovicinum TaxID=3228928 RepID=A0ABV3RCB9_9SPHN